jgi:hypothetical protein
MIDGDSRDGRDDRRPTPSPSVSAFPLGDDLVLYDEPTAQVFILNPTSAQIWALLDGSRSLRVVASAISERYGIDYQRALGDVDDLVVEMTGAGLLRSG